MNPRTVATRAAEWIKADGARTLRIAAVSFGISWLINFAIITSRGKSYGDVVATTTTGNIPLGLVYWGVLSATVAALVVYGLEVGWGELWASIKAFPRALVRLFKEEGPKAWSLFLWSGAIALAISGVLTPTLSAVFGIGFLALTPTAVMGIIGRIVSKVWVGVLGAFAPKDKPRAPGLGGQFVGVVGSTVGFLIASRSPSVAFKLISAAALAVISYIALTGTTSKATKLLGLAAMAGAWWLLAEGVAEALGGCCGGGEDHHHGVESGGKAAGLSVLGGGAAAAGGVAGGGVGGALGGQPPVDPSTIEWGDEGAPDGGDGGSGGSGGGGSGSPGSGDGATVTSGVNPSTATTPRTIILEADDAKAALDAWNEARDQGGTADIPIPHDEQWDLVMTDEDGNPVARQGHSGTRGEITGINIVAEGDGDLVINIDVSTYNPAGETPPDPIVPGDEPAPPGGDAATGAGGDSGAADTADSSDAADSGQPPPPPPSDTADGDAGGPPDSGSDGPATGETPDDPGPSDTETPPQDDTTDDTTPPDKSPPPPPPPPPPPEHVEEIPPVENQVPPPPPPSDGGDESATEPKQPDEADEAEQPAEEWPDPKDTEAFSDWAGTKLEEWGIMGHNDASAVEDFLGDSDQPSVTVSGEFGGLPGKIISRVENTSTGVAIHTPTRDEIHVEVVDGRIRVRHDASIIGMFADQVMEGMQAAGADIPDIDEIMARANRTVDAFNQSLDGTNRTVTGIQTNPNGSISIQTGPTP